jgi:CRISPR-associated protein Csb2
MLQLELGFPLGRYFAAAHDNPAAPEWPPNPSRVFSALVAVAYQRNSMDPADREALQALEVLPPPGIQCPEADLTSSPERYVPINDSKTFLDAKKPSHPSRPRHVGRHFPVAYLAGEPIVRYVWHTDVPELVRQRLDALAADLTHVGTSHSQVVARFESHDAPAKLDWVPEEHSSECFLRVTQPGRLDELDRMFASSGSLLRRPLPVCERLHGYARSPHRLEVAAAPRHQWLSWRVREASWGIDTPETFARAVRKALMSLLGDDAPAAVHGHDPTIPHLAYLPLADVGHAHGSGKILGLAIALPEMPGDDAHKVTTALAGLQRVLLPDHQVARLEPLSLSARTPHALQPATWCGGLAGVHEWSTVTPVVLDRTPKRKTPDAIGAEIIRALRNAGFPEPEAVQILSASDFRGAPRALEVPSKFPRYHARVRFADAIRGPVFAGRGRNFGVGLFRPFTGEAG